MNHRTKEDKGMSFTYENQGNNTYLVYKIGASDNVDTMSLGMITNNKIEELFRLCSPSQILIDLLNIIFLQKVSAKEFLQEL